MHALRNARRLARLVLAWFALSLGAALASPVVQPQGVELVCAGGVMKLMTVDEGGPAGASQALDCPLCTPAGAPPAPAPVAAAMPLPLGHALQPIPAARIAALTAAPLPARGPPVPLLA
ncbi:hypothetical protein [Ramlibacter tataouinensis]|uniref:DUF2946 domain-containing protein n=1 Tax=Ramlibacter tataouinensis (strain ATCC BAA-407 / DSM 14655 / LMG 21543 / TTB310) TaxID=365046 RepID=F5Y1H4_RAMTT|nr:hypothetical protein [Ramlibacter tataouinensis]AEG94758.1 Conserved hypothetical protein [Ramlibacter tataouinensis TTB310]